METNSKSAPAAPQLEKQKLLKPALSFLGAHAGGVLIANILCFGLAGMMSNMGLLLCIPLILLVYSMPVYGTLWGMGMSDSNKANFGHIVLDRWRGAKIALVGMIPWIVCSVLFLLSKFGLFWNFVVPYKIINGEVWPIINALHVFAGQKVSMYLPAFSYGQVIAAAVVPLIPILIAEFAYYLGTKDISISQRLIYKNKKKPAAEQKTTYQQYQERQKPGAAPQAEEEKPKASLLHKIMYKDDDRK